MSADNTLISKTATEMVDLMDKGEVTPLDALDALEARIAEVDPKVNALPTLCFDRARARAGALMRKPAPERGVLRGLPVPIKDLTEVEGVRTTFGSPIFADHVPARSDAMVELMEARGAVIYAKSNTPEFGAGASTFNEVFGRTLNPWNTTRSPAGSSGGAAAALASGMAWVAQGTDLGGSLRNPASFCGVVGLRPSPGRVPAGPAALPWDSLGVKGPMARNVPDLALLLDAMAGQSDLDPLSFVTEPGLFSRAAASRARPARIAFSRDLGVTPVDPEVAAICEAAARRFEEIGVAVEEACPDFSGTEEVFQTLRALNYAASKQPLLDSHRDLLKPEVIWNIEKGLSLTVQEVMRAERERARIMQSAVAFFADYDLLLSPATIVPAFGAEERYCAECDGHVFDNYIQWLAVAYAITITSCPALSLPCGFTKSGLPVGLQMVARPRGEAGVIAAAAALDDLLGFCAMTPIDPREG